MNTLNPEKSGNYNILRKIVEMGVKILRVSEDYFN